ncbi:MAG TPA: ZIP family zinc transporter [Acidimicrobiia bacterium]|jgi:ZIP family zinc transporter|nr:ZIP family zinc transporter [Acidimicrobiia bacterium]
MAEAAFWGLLGASSLIIGAEVAFGIRLNRLVVGLIMAFGVGALISSVSFELVVPALEAVEFWEVAAGLIAGALAFFLGDRLINQLGGANRKSSVASEEENSGMGIALGTFLDGIPESAVLGMSLVGGEGVSTALLAGIWVSNLPESLGSTVNLDNTDMSRRAIRLLWLAIVAVSALAAAIGFAFVDGSSSRSGALIQTFAAGALLTMIADEMAPEAYERSNLYAGLATVAGFALAVFLTSVEG